MVALFDIAGRVDLELERFEAIPAGDRFSLLRVGARWVLAPGVSAPTPMLVVQRGARRDRFAPLPDPAADYAGDGWAAGYAVPLDLILDARVRYWLEADGPRYPLPSPEERPLLDGRRPEVVIRNGRPHLLLAAGLMAVALAPLAGAKPAVAQEPVPVTTPPADPAQPVTEQSTTPDPPAE